MPHPAFSVSKSFVSVAVGMAAEAGTLSPESRLVDFFPDRIPAPDEKLSALRLRHLLGMSRGFRRFSRPATVAEALAQPLEWQPGQRFVCDNGSTFLASAMFTRATGITVLDFLARELFAPLGIARPEWPAAADGHTQGGTGLMLSTNDLAFFGQLLLDGGTHKGKSLVPRRWIEHATRPHIATGSADVPLALGYGLGFWPSPDGTFRADGKNGQFVVVAPWKEAVVAINSDEPRHNEVLRTVYREILDRL